MRRYIVRRSKPLLADPLAFDCPPRVSTSSLLNELCGGDFDGLSVKEIQDRYPAVWHRRMADKLRFRYPGAGGSRTWTSLTG